MNAADEQHVFAPKRHLPRLDPAAYRGMKHVNFTATTQRRQRLFVKRAIVDFCVELLQTQCAGHACECLVYCFMPDHVHMILHGLDEASDARQCHNDWKGATGKYLAQHCSGTRHWQAQSYDHVLRAIEYERGALRKMIGYILENPVRAGLVTTWQEYPFVGSLIGPCDIRHPYWWEWFYE